MKRECLGDSVVKSFAEPESVIDEVVEPGLASNLAAKRDHTVEEMVEGVAIGESSVGHEPPSGFAEFAIVLFLQRGHLRGGSLFAAEGNGHRADELLIGLLKLGELGLARDIRLAIKRPTILERPVENLVAFLRQFGAKRRIKIFLANRVLKGLQARLDVADVVEKRLLANRVVGLASHGHVPLDSLLANGGVQLADVPEPGLQFRRRTDLAVDQLLEPRLDRLPRLERGTSRQPLRFEHFGDVRGD